MTNVVEVTKVGATDDTVLCVSQEVADRLMGRKSKTTEMKYGKYQTYKHWDGNIVAKAPDPELEWPIKEYYQTDLERQANKQRF